MFIWNTNIANQITATDCVAIVWLSIKMNKRKEKEDSAGLF